ncbi:MAG: transglycosylase SLT domain-containing protein [Thermoleophilaceae bacterium]|nr:transglycosylase SLT domain-containing protein [Thermoleophilaceae bacterium]
MYRLALAIGLLVACAVLAAFALLAGDDPPEFGAAVVPGDPFAYEPERAGEFVSRATAGHSHVLHEKSPGGVVATARRVERWRDEIDEIASTADVAPEVIEGMVFLESAGYPDAQAGDELEGAVGLTQILAGTATHLLGMRVDVEASERLTRRIARADDPARVRRLEERRRAVDERFHPRRALEGAARYLAIAKERFGRDDLAVASYHMGIGNLESVLRAYGEDDASWSQLYFDATPRDHPRTYRLLAGFGDDSATYLWRVYAAREIMRLYREDRGELRRLTRLHAAKASGEEVLHPRARTEVFERPDDLEDAYAAGQLRPFPNQPAKLGLRRDPDMGELAPRLDAEPALYRGLRPEAYALAAYLAAGVRQLAGTSGPLIVTSTVRDLEYQRLLERRNPYATTAYSLHTTGFAFDIRRRYVSRAQAVAFQYMLDRLQSLNLIAWVREPGAIHITASTEARELVPRS